MNQNRGAESKLNDIESKQQIDKNKYVKYNDDVTYEKEDRYELEEMRDTENPYVFAQDINLEDESIKNLIYEFGATKIHKR